MFTWSFTGIAKFGPWSWGALGASKTSSGKLTSKAWGVLIVVTIQSWDFKSYSKGKGSYNLINIVGLSVLPFSNLMLLAKTNEFAPKLR